jgi:hypothetical protein
MTRLAFEIIYLAAYCLFMLGAARSFRDNGSKSSVLIMTLGYLTDVVISLLPMTGIPFFQTGTVGTNPLIGFAIGFGIITVWLVYPVALIFWKKGKSGLFHFFIAFIEVCWFIDIVLFVYGEFRFPSE